MLGEFLNYCFSFQVHVFVKKPWRVAQGTANTNRTSPIISKWSDCLDHSDQWMTKKPRTSKTDHASSSLCFFTLHIEWDTESERRVWLVFVFVIFLVFLSISNAAIFNCLCGDCAPSFASVSGREDLPVMETLGRSERLELLDMIYSGLTTTFSTTSSTLFIQVTKKTSLRIPCYFLSLLFFSSVLL